MSQLPALSLPTFLLTDWEASLLATGTQAGYNQPLGFNRLIKKTLPVSQKRL
ncbi:hypothetical protein ACFQY3_24645 [Paenibacillus farraposensis]|uniref:hypothetical protein n=1 Tax=Paenibacillus farraposensis TaxID=2807095 RepID=UPI00360C91D5